MKPINEKYSQTPTIPDAEDQYWEDHIYYYDDDYSAADYYDDYSDCYDGYGEYQYIYIQPLDIFKKDGRTTPEDAYEYADGSLLFPVYGHYGRTKLEAFFGCVSQAYQNEEQPTHKIQRLYQKLYNDYPEIVFKLLGI
jgi:hypothetical protein